MYAVIYWEDDNTVFPVVNEGGTLKLFESVKEADEYADTLERKKKYPYNDYCRVISIEGVRE